MKKFKPGDLIISDDGVIRIVQKYYSKHTYSLSSLFSSKVKFQAFYVNKYYQLLTDIFQGVIDG